jgi:hypothetical protein
MARYVILALFTVVACKGKPADLGARCDQLTKTCVGDDKHGEKFAAECKAATPKAGCEDKLNAMYDCYEKELCGKADKVWALDDLRVLADRNSKCAPERAAAAECTGK